MVESVELVLAALGAGAVAGVSNTSSKAVVEAYDGLKSAVRAALRRRNAQLGKSSSREAIILDAQLAEPEQHREELAAALTEAEVGRDAEVLDAARKLMILTDSRQYKNDVHDNTGVQVGDHNTMSIDLRSM